MSTVFPPKVDDPSATTCDSPQWRWGCVGNNSESSFHSCYPADSDHTSSDTSRTEDDDGMVCHGFRNSDILVEDTDDDGGNVVASWGTPVSKCVSFLKDKNFRRRPQGNPKKKKKNRKGNSQNRNLEQKTNCEILAPEAVRSQYIAMDCEMVGTGPNGEASALARVSLIDWYGKIVLDTYLKVHAPVTDLRTHVSGVTVDKIDPKSPFAMEYAECVDLVQRLIHGKVLVGHGLKNDLRMLGIHHPWYDIRDTAKYESFMKSEGGTLIPRKLKELARDVLGLTIQNSDDGHDSIEDAWTTMQLYKLVSTNWDEMMAYKFQKTVDIVSMQNSQQSDFGFVNQNVSDGLAFTVQCN